MERWLGRVALVTGASVGSGACIAERFVKHGLKVIGCARNVDQIQVHRTCTFWSIFPEVFFCKRLLLCYQELSQKLKGEKGSLEAIKCDLQKQEEILNMFSKVKEQYGAVDICVNNASLGFASTLLTGETSAWKNMFDVS